MAHPTLADARELSDWRPPMGVISIYLGFDPADRSAAWRIELRNGINRALELAEDGEHERKVAMRETAKRLLHRFNDEEVRPPPRGEAGFVEVSRGEGKERWWGTGVAPVLPAVAHADQPLVTELVDLCQRGEGCGVALLSAERVRLLGCAEGTLEEIEEWDRLAGERLRERGFGDVLAFGPRPDAEAFWKGLGSTQLRRELGGEQDLISMPRGELIDEVAAAIARSRTRRDRAFVERALEEALGGSRGGSGVQETLAALKERRVEHLAFDPAIGDPAEALVRGALAGDAEITIARDGVAELLAPAEGVAAILRY